MNKKFFTLLVGVLSAMSFGTFAQEFSGITSVSFTENGSSSLEYTKGSPSLLTGIIAQKDTVYLFVEGDRLLAKSTKSLPESYREWQAALWYINAVENTKAYEFKNLLTGFPLALDQLRAETLTGISFPFANQLGGNLKQWTPSANIDLGQKGSFFYTSYPGRADVIVLGLEDYAFDSFQQSESFKVVPLIYNNYEDAFAVAKDKNKADSNLLVIELRNPVPVSLTANDLNTKLNNVGKRKDGYIQALKDSYFKLQTSTGTSDLFSSLQAQGVINGVRAENSFSDESKGSWIALYSAAADNFIVADESGLLPPESKWRDSDTRFWFKLLYNFKTGQISVVSYSGLYLNYETTGGGYQFVKQENVDPFFSVNIPYTNEYSKIYVPGNLYFLQVSATNTLKDKDSDNYRNRKGKYVKLTFDGAVEFVDWDSTLQQNPLAHWFVESSDTLLKITNRELVTPNDYLPELGFSYGNVTQPGTFFFLDGDTLRFTAIPDTGIYDKKMKYRYFDKDEKSLHAFKYLSDNNNAYIKTVSDGSSLEIFTDGTYSEFMLEFVLTDEYGYNTSATTVSPAVQLERSAYRLVYNRFMDEEKWYVCYEPNTGSRKYSLKKDLNSASVFFFREFKKDLDESYYALIEAQYIPGPWVEIDAFGAVKKEYPNGITSNVAAVWKNIVKAEWNGSHWVAQKYGNKGIPSFDPILLPFLNAGLIEPVRLKGDNDNYYVRVVNGKAAISSMLYVNKESLLLTNGELDENAENAALFSVTDGRYSSTQYRTIGNYSGENPKEQWIRIFTDVSKNILFENSIPNGRNEMFNYLSAAPSGGYYVNESSILARFVRGTDMPQYLFIRGQERVESRIFVECPVHGIVDEHSVSLSVFSNKARFLTSMTNRVLDKLPDQFIGAGSYLPLSFIEGEWDDTDSTVDILGEPVPLFFDSEAGKVKEGPRSPILFSFRLVEDGSRRFMLETLNPETNGRGWVKIINNEPALVTVSYDDAIAGGATLFTLETATSNNDVIRANKAVISGGSGNVAVKGAVGKKVVISTILGKIITNQVLSSDEVVIAAPAGLVIVAVEGEPAVKALVK
ncbi:hypothetical protein Barb4_00532 [Bacteroidales bacterium Barb4]|nr:hypothetical protein Barb4_00532 [Bacteroidales bacterium Barb4]